MNASGPEKIGYIIQGIKTMELSLKSAYDFKGLKDIYNLCNDYLIQSAAEKGLPGPAEFTPGQWLNRLTDLYFMLFFNNPGIVRNRNNINIDKQKVVSIYRYIYKPLCNEYNQIIYISDFCSFIGIANSNISNWDNIEYLNLDNIYINIDSNSSSAIDIGKSKPGSVKLAEEIKLDSESCLASRMISDKGNPLRYLSILNHRYGWNSSDKPNTAEKPLTLAEIRQSIGLLSAGDGRTAEKPDTPHKIQQNKRKVSEK